MNVEIVIGCLYPVSSVMVKHGQLILGYIWCFDVLGSGSGVMGEWYLPLK